MTPLLSLCDLSGENKVGFGEGAAATDVKRRPGFQTSPAHSEDSECSINSGVVWMCWALPTLIRAIRERS
jgi:hypothetical protein